MFKKISHLLTLILLLLLLAACGGGGGGGIQGFSDAEKRYLYALFKSEYLWASQVTSNANLSSFQTPQQMINSLRVTLDRWSYMMTMEQYNNFANQRTAGFGFAYTADFTVIFTRIEAPAYNKLKRGDRILAINGESVSASLIRETSQNLGTPATFTIERNSNQLDLNITPDYYSFKVTLDRIIDRNGTKVGYLRYDSFTESSVNEFETSFTHFKNAGIDELVIDMRYNGGGSLSVASNLLDNITAEHPSKRQFYLDWNDNYKQNNSAYTFEESDLQDGNEFNLTRVFFLTTPNTASASEAVINALVPYLGSDNVILIGSHTHGKPVGMRGRRYGNHAYFLINFIVRNNGGDSISFSGIDPTCSAGDDIHHIMGDENETMFSTAIYYIENGNCP